MTTMFEYKTTCAVCSTGKRFRAISSTNSMGSPDLDTRPPPMQRSTIWAWVQRCDSCGYCASNLDHAPDEARDVIHGQAYRQQLNNPDYPELANSFLCKYLIEFESGLYAHATWSLVHASWACDDAGSSEQASECRRKAAKMLRLAEKKDQKVTGHDHKWAEIPLLVDLLRRADEIQEARKAIPGEIEEIKGDIIYSILKFQHDLLEKKDTTCHTIGDAVSMYPLGKAG